MPIRYERRYDPEFCRAHPDWLVVFGDNLHGYGKAGQAIIRDEPNAVGIPTKASPSREEGAYFTDRDRNRFWTKALPAFQALKAHIEGGGTVVLPEDGLGTGLADLERRSPVIWRDLQRAIMKLTQT